MTRRSETPRRRRVTGLLVLAVLTGAGCGVVRPPPEPPPGAADLPNLRRASLALRETIADEQEHVESLKRQLAVLRVQEEQLHRDQLEAEAAYQRLQDDLDGVAADVQAAEIELAGAQSRLGSAREELQTTTGELEHLETELRAARIAVGTTRSESLALQAEAADDAALLAAWRRRLEPFRRDWGVGLEPWNGLLAALALGQLTETEARSPLPEPAPPEEPATEPAAGAAATDTTDGAGAETPPAEASEEGGGEG